MCVCVRHNVFFEDGCMRKAMTQLDFRGDNIKRRRTIAYTNQKQKYMKKKKGENKLKFTSNKMKRKIMNVPLTSNDVGKSIDLVLLVHDLHNVPVPRSMFSQATTFFNTNSTIPQYGK